jgi:S1-C subfamily serine protease
MMAVLAANDDPLLTLETHQQKLFEQIAPSVVLIHSKDALGSGFYVSSTGLILTNAHVVANESVVEVTQYDGKQLRGEVIERAEDELDLAMVKVDAQSTPALNLGGIADVRVGSWVAAIGHGEGRLWSFNTGMISNIYREGAERPLFQTQIPLNPGNSGGPIFDRKGHVIGIVTAGITQANAINFGISMEVARRSMHHLADSCDCLTITAPEGIPIFVDGAMVGSGPKVVVTVREHKELEVFAVVKGRMSKQHVTFPKTRSVSLK